MFITKHGLCGYISHLSKTFSKINHILWENEKSKVKPLRDKNLEVLSKLQRLNLELKNLEDKENRTKEEKDSLNKINKWTC